MVLYAFPVANCQNPGFVNNSTRQMTGHFTGDTVKYICHPGYKISFGDSERHCLGKGQWNGTKPVCTGKELQISDLNGTKSLPLKSRQGFVIYSNLCITA